MTESRISQDIVDDVSVYWVIDDRPSMTGFAKKHGLNARTLRRWRYRGWLDLARFQESLFRDFAEELSKAQDERKQVDAEMKRIRDENKRSTSTLPEENASGRTKWGDVVSGSQKTQQRVSGAFYHYRS
jgi:hypothetical protein